MKPALCLAAALVVLTAPGRAAAPAANDPLAWVENGRRLYSQGDQLAAIDAANRALLIDPDNVRALELRAQMLREQAGWVAALPLYERALLGDPRDLDLLAGYAGTLGEAGRVRDMLTVTRRMIEIDAKDPRSWFFQAVLAARAGKTSLARNLIARTGRRLDAMPAASLLRGALELEAGNANVAATILDPLVQRQPANTTAQLLLARALYEAGDLRGLIGRFTGAAQRPDASPYLLAVMGRALEEAGDRAAAAPYLDRLAAAKPLPVMPMLYQPANDAAGAVRARLLAGDLTGADTQAATLAERRPGMFEAQALAGDAALANGKAPIALDRFRKAMLVRFPERLLLRTTEALEQTGQGRSTPALVTGYHAAFPGSLLASRLAAGHAALSGDWARSRSDLEDLVARTGTRDGRVMADLALAQLQTGDAGAALVSAERAAQLLPNSGFPALAWGLALSELGEQPDLARQLLRKVRCIEGDSPRLAEALDRVGN
ncbi:Tfp pilus assembly protein PilF [Novosphingobium kunmingense]|uniref:Tfp pilus assembly protein PilF n=1 Tax=Novosphingobium kunmingense TaxID=1211806 RepID=A0A2N0I1U8_9SPHN|nr:tetratricopeptide repeat protein [Novosphingobium kunmingense]PKB25168.1 Tfp pilus assembly protein PilF [Novosphingobium kunmingense]